MDTIYEIKEGITSQDLEAIGYDLLPYDLVGNDVVMAKIVEFPKDHILVRQAIDYVLNNKAWQQEVLFNQNLRDFLAELNILFEEYTNENGQKNLYVIENEELFELVCNWRIEVNFSDTDKWLGLTSSDIFVENVYFNTKFLNAYCKKEVEELLELDYISIKEV